MSRRAKKERKKGTVNQETPIQENFIFLATRSVSLLAVPFQTVWLLWQSCTSILLFALYSVSGPTLSSVKVRVGTVGVGSGSYKSATDKFSQAT